jgi:cell division protein FtsL
MGATMRSAWMEAWEADWQMDGAPSAAARRSAARENARVGARTRSARYYGREATARLPQATPESPRTEPLPKPRLVTRRRSQWHLIVAALVFAAILLGVAVVSPMLLSSKATEVESQVGRMESSEAQLSASIAALSSQISALSAPQRVAEQAAQLGLEPAEQVQYVQSAPVGTEGDTTVAGR